MKLAFFVLEGPQKGKKWALQPNFVIGRLRGDIVISDSKISSRHAQIELGEKGELKLIDLGSTNGIKISGSKVSSIVLNPGLRLQLGNTLLEVQIDLDEDSKSEMPSQTRSSETEDHSLDGSISNKQLEATPPSDRIAAKVPLQWNEVLLDFIRSKRRKIKDFPKPLIAFDPPLILTFIRGLQFDTRWSLGFGPRLVGAESIDLPILEPGAPPLCFEILPSSTGPIFKTNSPDIVLYNGQPRENAPLKTGDMVSILDCQIKVEFDEKSQ